MGMGFSPTWLRQVTPLLHKTTLTTAQKKISVVISKNRLTFHIIKKKLSYR